MISISMAALAALTAPALAAGDDFVLILDDLQTRAIRLAEVTSRQLFHVDNGKGWNPVDLSTCVAVFDPAAPGRPDDSGMLRLVDGQRLPGEAVFAPPQDDTLAWRHPWLGRLDVPLSMVSTVQLTAGAPLVEPGDEDVVVLANGDRQEGLIVAFGDPVRVEVTDGAEVQEVSVPLDRVVSVAVVNPRRTAEGRRLWFRDGSVIDVSSVKLLSDGYLRLNTAWLPPEKLPYRARIEEIAALLFDAHAMVPLADLGQRQVEGPATRYVVAPPVQLDPNMPLGLSRISLHGPLTIRYVLPDGTQRFAARAHLPAAALRWGDFELTVLDDDKVVFRDRLNGENPSVEINVELAGSELTLRLTDGRYGPIQDVLILERAMVGR